MAENLSGGGGLLRARLVDVATEHTVYVFAVGMRGAGYSHLWDVVRVGPRWYAQIVTTGEWITIGGPTWRDLVSACEAQAMSIWLARRDWWALKLIDRGDDHA